MKQVKYKNPKEDKRTNKDFPDMLSALVNPYKQERVKKKKQSVKAFDKEDLWN